jgi:hypothetical protein
MFIIDWVFDKMGYTKKVDIVTMFSSYKVNLDDCKKIATKRKSPAKKSPVAKKTVKSRAKKV